MNIISKETSKPKKKGLQPSINIRPPTPMTSSKSSLEQTSKFLK